PQSPGLVVGVLGLGDKLCASQVGVTGEGDELSGGVVGQVDPLFGHGPATGLGTLGDPYYPAKVVVGPLVDELGRAIDLGFQFGAATDRIIGLVEGHHGCQPHDAVGQCDHPAQGIISVRVVSL